MNFKIIALVVFTATYLYDLMLAIVRAGSARNPIPANVADVYDPETYQKWRTYHSEKSRLSIISMTAAFVINLILLAFNLYAAFATLFNPNPFAQIIAVMLLSTASEILLIPFSYYNTMVIEEKYGFNRSKKGTFWADQIKSTVIGLGVSIGIASLLMWVHRLLGDWLILAFAVLMTMIMLGIVFLYPVLSRVFNKFTPLQDGELKDKVTALLNKHGYKVRAIKVIVLYDTLVNSMTVDEICAVFAHEMGHGLHKDTLKNQIMSFAQMLILGTLAWLTLRTEGIFTAFGFTGINYGFASILILSVEFAVVAPLFGLVISAISRRAEYRADRQAVEEGYADSLVSALKKLARQNFSDLAPPPVIVKLEYSHPTLSQRIDAIYNEQWSRI